MSAFDPLRTLGPSVFVAGRTSISALQPHCDFARPIEDRHVACHAAKNDDGRQGHVPAAVIDDEIVIAPQSQSPAEQRHFGP